MPKFIAVAIAVALVLLLPQAQANEPAKPNAEAASARGKKPRTDTDPMEDLRDRLAKKLGAVSAAGAKGEQALHVITQPDGELRLTPAARAASDARVASPKAPAAKAAPKPAHRSEAHWAYEGEAGPQAWHQLKPEFSQCSTGSRQSPIDIRDGIRVDMDPVQFDYRASAFRVIDNGHTVQVNVAPGNFIGVMGRRYELQQFHFHRPSEERIEGRQFDMVAHLVHKDLEGRLAVVAVLLQRGPAHALVQAVWNNLPLEKGEELAARAPLDLSQLLPQDPRYFTYMGSLTTPPCTEGVLWMVMQQPVTLSPEQVDVFARLYPMNARPLQHMAGRMIKQSN